MSKIPMSIHVFGNDKEYYLDFMGDPQYLDEWCDYGLEIDVWVEDVDSTPELHAHLSERKKKDDEVLEGLKDE